MTIDLTTATPAVENDLAGVDVGFEQRLIEALQPIRGQFLAAAFQTLLASGLYDHLEAQGPTPVAEAIDELGLDRARAEVLLLCLANEGVVDVADGVATLAARGRALGEFRSWYTFLVGGYGGTLAQLPAAMSRGAEPCGRSGADVALGSCEIARYDGIPLTRALLSAAGSRATEVLDLGCGNGLYLAEFCAEMPAVRAWGAEPDGGGYAEAVELIDDRGLADRVRLVHRGAVEFLAAPPADCRPDLLVFGFVLQEVLEQEGEEAVVALLRRAVETFPALDVVVVEVSHDIDDPGRMRHGYAQAFWNPYFLIHPFTRQRLERRGYWEALFAKAGLAIAAHGTTDPRIDSTGIEVGYLLRGPAHPTRTEPTS